MNETTEAERPPYLHEFLQDALMIMVDGNSVESEFTITHKGVVYSLTLRVTEVIVPQTTRTEQ